MREWKGVERRIAHPLDHDLFLRRSTTHLLEAAENAHEEPNLRGKESLICELREPRKEKEGEEHDTDHNKGCC